MAVTPPVWRVSERHAAAAEPAWAEPDGIAPWRRTLDRALRRSAGRSQRWSAEHWLALANAGAALILLGAVAAPLLSLAGLESSSRAIHTVYRLLCPQRPSHSFYLLGAQLALEQRMLAMFAAALLGGLLFALVRERVPLVDWRPVAATAVPFLWDVLSQTAGLRDSDWANRAWTGMLVTLAVVWWLYPRLDRVARLGLGDSERPAGIRVAGSGDEEGTRARLEAAAG